MSKAITATRTLSEEVELLGEALRSSTRTENILQMALISHMKNRHYKLPYNLTEVHCPSKFGDFGVGNEGTDNEFCKGCAKDLK